AAAGTQKKPSSHWCTRESRRGAMLEIGTLLRRTTTGDHATGAVATALASAVQGAATGPALALVMGGARRPGPQIAAEAAPTRGGCGAWGQASSRENVSVATTHCCSPGTTRTLQP